MSRASGDSARLTARARTRSAGPGRAVSRRREACASNSVTGRISATATATATSPFQRLGAAAFLWNMHCRGATDIGGTAAGVKSVSLRRCRSSTNNTCETERVVLAWETAYGKAYQIQISNHATHWTTIYTQNNGTSGTENLTGPAGIGRYIRLFGTALGTQWGYSLWSFQVYAA